MKSYLLILFQQFGKKVSLTFVIFFLLVLFEGIGFMLLIPMLGFIGILESGGVTGKIEEGLTVFFAFAGLPKTLGVILTIYVLLVSCQQWLMKQQLYISTEVRAGIQSFYRNRLFQLIVNANWLFLVKKKHSDFTHSLAMDIIRISFGVINISQIITGLSMLTIYLVFAFFLSPELLSVAVICVALLLIVFRKRTTASEKTGKKETRLGERFLFLIAEHLGSMKLAKTFSAEERTIRHFSDTAAELEQNMIMQAKEGGELSMYFAMVSTSLFSILFYCAVELFQVMADTLILLMAIFARTMPAVSSLLSNMQQLLRMRPALVSYGNIEKQCLHAAEHLHENETAPLGFENQISFQNVWFRYDKEAEDYALEDVSFTLEASKTTAITGPSGVGKSTVADMVLGLLIPDKGEVLIDGVPLTPERISGWRKSIAYVPQETFLFHDTIRNNLLWAKPHASGEDIEEALKLSASLDFVRALPKGLDSVIGERGVRLSGGERQRLTLARAILMKPKLLILDEATSALDNENEERIREAIETLHGDMSILIIAHRETTIRNTDKVILLTKRRAQ